MSPTIDCNIVRQGREEVTPLLVVADREGFIGLRALNSPSTMYLALSDLDYRIDEVVREQLRNAPPDIANSPADPHDGDVT